MYKLIFTFICMYVVQVGSANATSLCSHNDWQDWLRFKQQFVSFDGRVIDSSDKRRITTSEGQSYAMFFALIANDKQLFNTLLNWTERNLARGDLTAYLPSWLWGLNEANDYDVLDSNTASDSNLWIAYTLIEAGRLWNEHQYSMLGTLLLQRIGKEEIKQVPNLGYMLMPGKKGFKHENIWRFNPSYMPLQLIMRASDVVSDISWSGLYENTLPFLLSSSPAGVAPDWISWNTEGKGSWVTDSYNSKGYIGSYDAIRVYLWAGMLHPDTQGASNLRKHFKQIQKYIGKDGGFPEVIDVVSGNAKGQGGPGFTAALLPLFYESITGDRLRAALSASKAYGGYYESVLKLFALGWDQKQYQFDARGKLITAWENCL